MGGRNSLTNQWTTAAGAAEESLAFLVEIPATSCVPVLIYINILPLARWLKAPPAELGRPTNQRWFEHGSPRDEWP